MKTNPEDIDVVILCGGLGTRLRGIINDRPKVMAEIKGRPFLDMLIDHISNYKFRRFILCVGYMKDVIKRYYETLMLHSNTKGNENNPPSPPFNKGGMGGLSDENRNTGLTILFSEEKEPLGTAGAIKNAEPLIKSNPFLVMNGDSFCDINLKSFLDFHIEKKASTSIALVPPEKDADYGAVALDNNRCIVSFNEKAKTDTDGFINAGIYFFCREILESIPPNMSYSLEYDLFPNILDKGVYGYIAREKLIDIGTPERYRIAEKFLSEKK